MYCICTAYSAHVLHMYCIFFAIFLPAFNCIFCYEVYILELFCAYFEHIIMYLGHIHAYFVHISSRFCISVHLIGHTGRSQSSDSETCAGPFLLPASPAVTGVYVCVCVCNTFGNLDTQDCIKTETCIQSINNTQGARSISPLHLYAFICRICKNEMHMQNIQKYASPVGPNFADEASSTSEVNGQKFLARVTKMMSSFMISFS